MEIPRPRAPIPEQAAPAPGPPQEPATIQGKVVNAITGEPVNKVSVTLMTNAGMPNNSALGATTDASGAFVIFHIPPGAYRLMAARLGYILGQYGSTRPQSAGALIRLAPGQALKEITVPLTPHGVIAGRVLDEDGEPLANVQVQALTYRYVQGKRTLTPGSMASTNDLGEYRIFGLIPGRHYLSATYRGMGMFPGGPVTSEAYPLTYFPGVADAASATALEVAPGRQLTNIDVRLSRVRAVRVSGIIANMPESSVRAPTVMAMPKTSFMGADRRSVVARPNGAFDLPGLTPGSYWLIAQFFDGNKQLQGREAIEVGRDNIEGISITLSVGIDIPVVLEVEGAATPLNMRGSVTLAPKEGMMMFAAQLSAQFKEGRAVLPHVMPERYTVTVNGIAPNAYLKAVRFGNQNSTGSEISVSGASQALTVVISTAGGEISGSALTEKKEPARTATIVLVPDAPDRDKMHLYKMSVLDEKGSFNLRGIRPGEYKLFAWEAVENGAWFDPDFLRPVESKGKSLSIRENGKETVQIEVLPEEKN